MEKTVRGWSILYMLFGVAGAIMGVVQLVDETGGAVVMNQFGETWIRSGGDFGTVVYLLIVVALAAVGLFIYVMYYNMDYKTFYGL